MAFTDPIIQKFLGKGLIFPILLDSHGTAIVETGFPLIRASLKNLLTWEFGSRFFLGEYGSRLESLLAEPNDVVVQGLINDLIVEAIDKFETRIELINTIVNTTDNSISVNLTYRIINSRVEDSFIFPFYTKPLY